MFEFINLISSNQYNTLLEGIYQTSIHFHSTQTFLNYKNQIFRNHQSVSQEYSFQNSNMNKSNRDYQRNQTTNSFNQDFIYYKYSKDLSKSPKFNKRPYPHDQVEQANNHSKIQSMKNTLNTLFDPNIQHISKSFNRSVADEDVKRNPEMTKSSKSVHQQDYSNANYNNKLQMLTTKLRQIAQKPHFSIAQEFKKSKTKQSARPQEDTCLANMSVIPKGSDHKQNSKFEELFSQQSKRQTKDRMTKTKGYNFSQELTKSKMKISNSLFDQSHFNEMSNSNSQSSSIKRQGKGLKNDRSVATFNIPQPNLEFQVFQRPRGKTLMNMAQSPMALGDIEQTKIKINSYVENRQTSKSFQQDKKPNKQANVEEKERLYPHTIKILKPHRGPITSVIINSDGRRFLSASNDYSVKESTLDGIYTTIRRHQGRVNVMRMIDDKLFTGGNDCKVKYEKESFLFQSPVLELYPHQKSSINVGTNSAIELFDVIKRVSTKSIKINTKFYTLNQKINKEVYFLDNHSLSVIDWRVPFPLINLIQQEKFIENWVSDPYTLDFYQIRNKKLIYTNNSKSSNQQYDFQETLRDYCWKKDKVYFLTDTQVKIFQTKKNQFINKDSYILESFKQRPTKINVKNDLWICGTRQGSLIVNQFQ